MLGLLLKEHRMTHSLVNFIALVCFLFAYVLNDISDTDGYNSVVLVALLCDSSVLIRFYSESNNNCNSFFASMPYSRAQIVASMYIHYIFSVYILILLLAVILTFFDIPTASVGMSGIIVCMPTNLVLLTFYATYGKKSIRNSYITKFVSSIFMVALNVVYRAKLKSTFIFNEGLPLLFIILLMLGVCSFLLSVHFFKKRDI